MTEKQLQDAIAELAQVLGYMVFHARPAMNRDGTWVTPVKYDGKGYPDLTIAGHGVVLFAEIKSAKGKETPEQEVWLSVLTDTDNSVYTWHPHHWTDGTIEDILRNGEA